MRRLTCDEHWCPEAGEPSVAALEGTVLRVPCPVAAARADTSCSPASAASSWGNADSTRLHAAEGISRSGRRLLAE